MLNNSIGSSIKSGGRSRPVGPHRLRTVSESRNACLVHENVYRRLRSLIVSGALAEGARIASSRKLAKDFGISRNSVLTAMDRLIADGWLEARDRSGVYVTYSGPRVMSPAQADSGDKAGDKTPFAWGWASDIFPVHIWNRLQSRRWRRMPETLLEQGDREGLPALRAAIAAHVTLRRGLECSPAQVVIATSIPAAIDLAIGALGLSGSEFWIENPCCIVTRRALLRAGIRLAPIPVDRNGADVEYGMKYAPQASAALVSPACQIPTGVVLDCKRRRQLAQWAERNDAWIFEDDFNWNGDGRSAPSPPYAAIDRRRTIYFNSFNNLLFSGLRVAYLVAPSHLIERFATIRGSEGDVNSANQMILTDFIEGGYFDAHLRRLDECNRERRAALADGVERELPEFLEPRNTPGGYYVCGLKRVSETGAFSACSRANIVISSMSEFFLTPTPRNEIVLGFSRHRPKTLSRSAAALRAALAAAV